nr:T9SS type A sorting domain-containing protein [Polaribacter sp. Z022]
MYSQNESDFYTETWNNGVTKNLVTDFGANGNDALDDSSAMQAAINNVTALANGGKIIIPAGTYYLGNINMKSKVHLVFDKDAIVKPIIPDSGNWRVFSFGKKSATVKDVSIRGDGGKFTIDFRVPDISKNLRGQVFLMLNVDNFLIDNFHLLDDNTIFNAANFGFTDYNGQFYGPQNGVFKNASDNRAHAGYGIAQVRIGKHILFKDLVGNGGVTLRIESGSLQIVELHEETHDLGIFDIVGRNISGSNCNSALMISPHTMTNGKVDVENVTTTDCATAVRIDKGFDEHGYPAGTFSDDCIVSNVTANYGVNAQLNWWRVKYLPCDKAIRDLVSTTYNPDGESYNAPAIAAIINTATGTGAGTFNVNFSNVIQNGFEYQSKTMLTTEDNTDTTKNSWPYCESSLSVNSSNLLEEFILYPNPTKDFVHINLPNVESITLYNILGKRMDNISFLRNNKAIKVDVRSLKTGVYFLKIKEDSSKPSINIKLQKI